MITGKISRVSWSRCDIKILKDVFILLEKPIIDAVEHDEYILCSFAKWVCFLQGKDDEPGQKQAYNRIKKRIQAIRKKLKASSNKQKLVLEPLGRAQGAESDRTCPSYNNLQVEEISGTVLESAGIWTADPSRPGSCTKSGTAAAVRSSIGAKLKPQLFSEYFFGVSKEASKQASLTTATEQSSQLREADRHPLTLEEKLVFVLEGLGTPDESECESEGYLGKRHSGQAAQNLDRNLSESGELRASQKRLGDSTQGPSDMRSKISEAEMQELLDKVKNNSGTTDFDLDAMNGGLE